MVICNGVVVCVVDVVIVELSCVSWLGVVSCNGYEVVLGIVLMIVGGNSCIVV